MEWTEWKVGNRVKVVDVSVDRRRPQIRQGQEGTVVLLVDGSDMVLVEFDEYVDGHDGNRIGFTGKNGHCWWFEEVDDQYTYGVPTLQEFGIRLEKIRTKKKNNYW